jgi:Tannase-like family of unknown function (DUF6351)
VPYIVRLETGTLDRGIYQIGILDGPFEAASPGNRGWNRRLQNSAATLQPFLEVPAASFPRLVAGAPATDGIL